MLTNMGSCFMLQVGLLAVYLLLLAGAASPSCCPTCNVRSIDPMNADQVEQIRSHQGLIQQIKLNPLLAYSRKHQRSVVTLTRQQQSQILRNFPDLFLSERDFRKSLATRGRITVPGREMYSRRKRQAIGTRVCEPLVDLEPLKLTVNLDGEVVEIIQLPGQSLNQWILEETCDDLASLPPTALTCGLAERHVPAVFATVSSEPYIFDHAYVVVQSCVTLYE